MTPIIVITATAGFICLIAGIVLKIMNKNDWEYFLYGAFMAFLACFSSTTK